VITYLTFIDEVKMEIDDEKSPEKDHSYVRLDDSKEKTDSFPERQIQSPSAKSSSSAQGANGIVLFCLFHTLTSASVHLPQTNFFPK